jgi:Shikimate 5-dehydrogenase
MRWCWGPGGASPGHHAWRLPKRNVGKITIVNRTITRAEEVAALAPISKVSSWEEAWGDDVDMMVNTTSLGLGQDADGNKALEKAAGQLIKGGVAMDIVYKPIKTHFLEQAEYRGAITIDGLGMLVHQAAPAFEAFYGQPPSNPDKILRQLLGEFSS